MENQSWHFSWAGTLVTSFLSCQFPAPFHWSSHLFSIHFFLPNFASCFCSFPSFTTFAVVKMAWQKATFIQMRIQGLYSLQWQIWDPIFVGESQGQGSKHPVTSLPQSTEKWNKCMHASSAQLIFSKTRLSEWKGATHMDCRSSHLN